MARSRNPRRLPRNRPERANAPNPKRFQIMFAKLSIRTKIITVVAFLLVTLAGMGLLAVQNMRAMNANTVF